MVSDERRKELRRYIGMSLGFNPDPVCWTASELEYVDQEIDAERYWPRPIPVSERLPADNEKVLGLWGGDVWCMFSFDGQWHEATWDGSCVEEFHETVTHWLPLPPKPEC